MTNKGVELQRGKKHTTRVSILWPGGIIGADRAMKDRIRAGINVAAHQKKDKKVSKVTKAGEK